MKTLDAYTRVSRRTDRRQHSTEGQEADCRERIARLGDEVGAVWCDPGRSV